MLLDVLTLTNLPLSFFFLDPIVVVVYERVALLLGKDDVLVTIHPLILQLRGHRGHQPLFSEHIIRLGPLRPPSNYERTAPSSSLSWPSFTTAPISSNWAMRTTPSSSLSGPSFTTAPISSNWAMRTTPSSSLSGPSFTTAPISLPEIILGYSSETDCDFAHVIST